jgi:hypothetical protein
MNQQYQQQRFITGGLSRPLNDTNGNETDAQAKAAGLMTDADVRRLYDSRSWKRLRQTTLNLNPLCQACTMRGTVTAAVQVHHLISIRTEQGWLERFNVKLLLSLCTSCHSIMEAEIREQEKAMRCIA